MRIFRRILSGALSLVLTAALLCGAVAESGYQSITEVQASTPERWTQTYETPWRTVNIDVAIHVPAVEQFPVIRITARNPADAALTDSYRKVTSNSPGNFYGYMGEADFPLTGNQWIRYQPAFENGERPAETPENNPMTFQEALDTVDGECARLFGDVELAISRTVLQGRVYRYKTVNHERVWLEPVTDKGNYWMILTQQFHGIDYQPSMECYGKLHLSNEDVMAPRYVCCSVYSAQDFLLAAFLAQEVDVVEEDVPLLPFEEARAAIETEINAGHLRGIDTMELCYAPYFDPDDANILWLLPVWYAKGAYTRNPTREFTPWTDEDGHVADSGVESMEVVMQAQLGTLLDYNDTRRSRRNLPKVLTWDDVR